MCCFALDGLVGSSGTHMKKEDLNMDFLLHTLGEWFKRASAFKLKTCHNSLSYGLTNKHETGLFENNFWW